MNLKSLRCLLLPLALAAGGAFAQGQPVGRVLLAAGDTVAVRNGQTVRLQFNSPVEFKDVLRTGPASSLQVRFVDEGLISLRDNSEFAIEDYRFAAAEPESERAFFRLIKGGFRSVTGLIGHARNANYRVQTQTATIGIRGTDYGVRMCAGDCGANVKDGLYGTVHGQSSGTNQITVTNEGSPQPTTFGINEHFYVADAKSPPQPLLVPPSFVSIKPQGKASAAQQGGSGNGGEQASASSGAQAESRPTSPETIVTEIVTPVLPFRVVESLNAAGTPVVLPPANGFGVVYPISSSFEGLFDDDNSTATYNSQNQLLGYKISTGPNGSLTGSVTDTGGITASNGQVFTWGRWTAGTITTKSGSVLNNVPLLFITASGLQQNSNTSSIGGQGTYTFVGGPHAVDSGGNTGTVTSSSLGINFTAQTVSYSIGISFASIGTFGPAILSLSGTGTNNSGQNNGAFKGTLSGSCSGGGCFGGGGSVSGGFDVGLAGPNGYDFAVVGGGVNNGTRAGGVAFLNGYQVASFTPGPAPQNLLGQVAFANTSPFIPGATTSLSTNSTTYNTANQPTAFSNSGGTSGSLNTGTFAESGSTALIDGTTMNWGRWTGNAVVTQGATTVTNPGTGVPFVVGPGNVSMPTSGTFLYTFAGGPNPTNVNGVSGTWGGGSLSVSFGASSGSFAVATPLTMSVGGVSYNFSSCSSGCTLTAGNVTLGAGSPVFLNGTCVGGACSTSAAASAGIGGIFVGSQATGLALAGNTSSPAPTVSFAGAFKR